jgi:hypothetical protein
MLFYGFLIWIAYFFWVTLFENFEKLQGFDISPNYSYLFVSLVIFLVFFFSLWVLWQYILNSPHIITRDIHYINAVSWISKYIPWKVAMIATKVLYLKKKWIPKKVSFISCLYEHAFQIISSFVLCLPFIAYYFWWTPQSHYVYLSWIAIIFWILILHPIVFNRLINYGLSLLKKPLLNSWHFLSWKQIFWYTLWYAFSMILKWISFVFFVASITPISTFQEVIFYSFAWIFAWVIGILAIFTPNGIGVREWVLTALLTLLLPIELAILLSIWSRVWFSLCDGVIWLWVVWVRYFWHT